MYSVLEVLKRLPTDELPTYGEIITFARIYKARPRFGIITVDLLEQKLHLLAQKGEIRLVYAENTDHPHVLVGVKLPHFI